MISHLESVGIHPQQRFKGKQSDSQTLQSVKNQKEKIL